MKATARPLDTPVIPAFRLRSILAPLIAIVLGTFMAVLDTTQPLLELRVFRSPDFSLAIVVQWTAQIAMMGGTFLVPLFLQQLRVYGAFDTGLALLPQAVGAALFMPIGGKLFDMLGLRTLALAGTAQMLASTWILSQVSASTTATALIVPLILRGMGMGLMVMPLNAHLIGVAPRGLTSRVTALTNALLNVMGSLAIASLATLLWWPEPRGQRSSLAVRAKTAI
jgi:hypothetical protein